MRDGSAIPEITLLLSEGRVNDIAKLLLKENDGVPELSVNGSSVTDETR